MGIRKACYCAQLADAKSEEAKVLDLRFFRGYLLILLINDIERLC